MLEVFDDIEAKYPHLGVCLNYKYQDMIQYLLKAQALIAQEGEAGLEMGTRAAAMLLFLAVRSEQTDLGLAGLQYLRQYYGSPNAPDDLPRQLARFLVEYLPYIAEMTQLSRSEVEQYLEDARGIVGKTDTSPQLLDCFHLRALRVMGEETRASELAKEWRAINWNEEIVGCHSCGQTVRIHVALAYEDLEQALKLAEDWFDGTCKPCTRGPQEVFGHLALACWLQGDSGNATRIARKMEKVVSDSSISAPRSALLPLLRYYLASEQWTEAERWSNNLAEGILSTVFSVQRLHYLQAGVQLFQLWQERGRPLIYFPATEIPISPDENGNFTPAQLLRWFEDEAEALRTILNERNGNGFY